MSDYDCDVSPCRLTGLWEILFPALSKPVRYCGRHAEPHLRREDVEASKLR